MSAATLRIAVDIGGTFTDVVLDGAGAAVTAKVLTTYDDPANGVLAGIRQALAEAGAAPGDVRLLLHGTTLATNALIERRGALTALLTTAGHRDAVEMAFENRFEQYDVNIDRPAPLVPRPLRFGVPERLAADGTVLRPLDESALNGLARRLREAGVESVAVGLLHAYANPDHEQRIGAFLAETLPRVAVTLSSDVCPEIREYERLSTACANAYVKPLMGRYLASLERQLRDLGIAAPVLLMTSGGGLTTLETAARYPIRLVESGPAGGAILAARVAAQSGLSRVVSFDMGGTTAKLCLIDAAQPQLSRAFEVDRVYRFKKGSGLPVRIPVIEMVEIGAGGGSLASVDKLGRINVGPASAGSEPGPACYGRGGRHPAVTDADVVLGHVQAEYFAGGGLALDLEAARAALASDVGAALNLSAEMAAFGVAQVVDENMAAAARAHAVEWGTETAGRTLVAYGGAAPLHAAALADKLKIDRIVIPDNAGVGSAVGFLLAPVSYEVVRSRYLRLSNFDPALVNTVMAEMRAEADAVIRAAAPEGGDREVRRAFMRYAGQGYEIAVPLPSRDLQAGDQAALQAAFDAEYQRLYGRLIPDLEVEVLSWTLSLAAREASAPEPRPRPAPSAAIPERACRLFDAGAGSTRPAAVFRRSALTPGQHGAGPALIVEDQTTTVVSAGFDFRLDAWGSLVLERRAQAAAASSSAADAALAGGSDPLTTQLVWNRLLAIVEEQAQTLMRTAFSTVVREAGDLSAGVFDTSGAMLAQAVTGTPGHVNAMAAAVGKFLAVHPLDSLKPGDVLLTNDPWDGTGHLNDFTVVTPVYHQQRCVALFASTSHIADVGGRGFGPDANDLFEEGLQIPIMHLFREGRRDETLMALIRRNVRDPVVAEGDLYSLAACNDTGAAQLREMLEDFGLADLEAPGREILALSRQAMSEEIRRLPDGDYHHRMTVDGYDEPLELVCRLSVRGDVIDVDFAGSAAESAAGINVPLPYTEAYASFGVRCVVGHDIPNNAGSLGAVRVAAPPGCILNARRPRAVSARHAVGQMLPDVILGCLDQVLPGQVPAEGASCIWNPVFRSGHREADAVSGPGAAGEPDEFVINPIYNGGTGARPGKDGLSTTAFPSGVRTTPTEVNEVTSPLVIWRREYRTDSAGAGEHRGGLGQIIEVAHRHGAAFVVSKMFDRIGHPARGRQGGAAGAPGRVYLRAADGSETDLRGKGRDVVPAGDTLIMETPGGGGMGDPSHRDPERVQADRAAGLVSATTMPDTGA